VPVRRTPLASRVVIAFLVVALTTVIALAGAPLAGAAPASTTPTSPANGGTGTTSGSTGQQRATFGVGPATLSARDPRSYFSYDMGAGGSYTDRVAVVNYGQIPLSLQVFAADLGNAENGDISVGLQGTQFNDAGGWIKMNATVQTITVPAAKKSPALVILPFRISVPARADPGDHGAAIVAVLSTLGKNAKGQNVKLDQRVASRMYIRVAGPLHPALGIEDLTVSYHGLLNPIGKGTATVSYTVRNTGNVRLGGDETVRVTGLFGAKTKVISAPKIDLLFPRATQKVTVKVIGVLPTIFDKTKVTVTPLLFNDQPPMPLVTAVKTKFFHAIPWSLIGLVALIMLLGVLGVLVRRARRKPRPGGGPGRHGPNNGPSGPNQPADGHRSPTVERIGS
jgi:hypothetical protein